MGIEQGGLIDPSMMDSRSVVGGFERISRITGHDCADVREPFDRLRYAEAVSAVAARIPEDLVHDPADLQAEATAALRDADEAITEIRLLRAIQRFKDTES